MRISIIHKSLFYPKSFRLKMNLSKKYLAETNISIEIYRKISSTFALILN